MKKSNIKYFFILPLIIYSIAIFVFSNQEKPPFNGNYFIWQDKIYHFIGYFLYGLCCQLFFYYMFKNHKKALLFSFLWGVLYGASDEIHQYFVIGRTAEWFDWYADIAGVTFSFILNKTIKKITINNNEY